MRNPSEADSATSGVRTSERGTFKAQSFHPRSEKHTYIFDHSLRFEERVTVSRLRKDRWIVSLESANITLQPGIRETEEGFHLEGVDTYYQGPYEDLKEAVAMLLKSVINVDTRADLFPA